MLFQVNFEFLEFLERRQKRIWQIFCLLFADSFMQSFQPLRHYSNLFGFSECGFCSNGFTFYGIEVCKIIEKNTSSWIMGYQFFSEEDFRDSHSWKVEMEKKTFEVVVYLCVIIHFVDKKWEKSWETVSWGAYVIIIVDLRRRCVCCLSKRIEAGLEHWRIQHNRIGNKQL